MQVNEIYKNMLTEGMYEHDVDFEDLNLESIVLYYIERKVEEAIEPPKEPKEMGMLETELTHMSMEEYEKIESDYYELVDQWKRDKDELENACWREVKYDVNNFKINTQLDVEKIISKYTGV